MARDRKRIEDDNKLKDANGDSKSKYKIFKELPMNTLSKISQAVYLVENTPIISITNKKNFKIVNSEQFSISNIYDEFIEAKKFYRDDDDKIQTKIIDIPIDKFQKWFHVAYALTSHKSQGSTITIPHTIHEWDQMSNKCKYVSLSRSTEWGLCNLV